MKQNSSIMFHGTRKALKKSYFGYTLIVAAILLFHAARATAADKPERSTPFDPAKGFKPAQSDLTEVFLQIAGSLEYYGSPEPYLRHMQAEHVRIDAKYQQQLGRNPQSLCPAYMDTAYFDRFAANWKHIAPQLGLESLSKSTGHQLRAAIEGPSDSGTSLTNVFKRHAQAVDDAMTSSKPVPIPTFAALQTSMLQCLQLDRSPVQVSDLPPEQQAAIIPAQGARTAFLKLFSAIEAGLSPVEAQKVEAVILGIVTDVGRMAQSEIEVARIEASLDYRRSLEGPYSPEQETALSKDERKTLAEFLKKPRFTKTDLPALDKFYQGPYDRLSERGKDEMSKRLHAGMRPAS